MSEFKITKGSSSEEASVHQWIEPFQIKNEEEVISAWVSSLHYSSYRTIGEAPYSPNAPDYSLVDHVNDVVTFGRILSETVEKHFNVRVDKDTLDAVLLLHDLDKPILYERTGDSVQKTETAKKYPHGVLGAMFLRDLQFSDETVSIVATHAGESPFHGSSDIAWILHYADFFATDYVLRNTPGTKPFYQRKE